jgi:hypothetical protein
LVTASTDATARFWRIDLEEHLRAACALLGPSSELQDEVRALCAGAGKVATGAPRW